MLDKSPDDLRSEGRGVKATGGALARRHGVLVSAGGYARPPTMQTTTGGAESSPVKGMLAGLGVAAAIRAPTGLLSAPAASPSPASTSNTPCHHFTPRWGSGISTRQNQHTTTTSKSTARRLRIAAFAAQLVRIFVESASAPFIASVASAAGTRHRLLRDPRCLRRRACVAASLESTPAHTSST